MSPLATKDMSNGGIFIVCGAENVYYEEERQPQNTEETAKDFP